MAPLHRAAGCVTLVAYQSCASCRRLFNIFDNTRKAKMFGKTRMLEWLDTVVSSVMKHLRRLMSSNVSFHGSVLFHSFSVFIVLLPCSVIFVRVAFVN